MCASEKTEGFYFGYFWAYYMSCQIAGNWVGSYLLTRFSGSTFFLIMGLSIIATAFLFFALKDPEPIDETIVQIEDEP